MSDRERWAYEELRPGDIIQEGDEWQHESGRWKPFTSLDVSCNQVRHTQRARRPHNITMMLAAFANQSEVLAEVRADEKRLFDDLELLRSEYIKLQAERDKVHTEAVELEASRRNWIDRYNTEISPALQVSKQLTEAKDALKSAQRARDELQLQVDELRADRRDEVTARQVQKVLHRWATELEWSADCFGSATREQVHGVQNTLITVMQRIESMIESEGTSANT